MRILMSILLLSSSRAGENVLLEITASTDKGIPQDLLDKSHCVVVIPSMKKGALIVGAQYGKGFLTCRRPAVAGRLRRDPRGRRQRRIPDRRLGHRGRHARDEQECCGQAAIQ